MKRQPETGGKAKRYIGNRRRETQSNHLWYQTDDFRKSVIPQEEMRHVSVDVSKQAVW